MALERVSKLLRMADQKNTAIIGFNCTDFNMAYAVAKVAEELKKPAIIMLYPEHCYLYNVTNLSAFASMVKDIVKDMETPIGLHLDHSSDYDYIMNAINSGFTSVMYDGSMLSLEENIENTKKVVETAHIFDVDVEAELGRVGFASAGDGNNSDMYTKAESIKIFAEKTGVDSIAIAIGNAHGVYKEIPKLDFNRLDEINVATEVPLVLHGGSGIPNDQLDEAFKRGINKFNVGTEYFMLYYNSIKDYCERFGSSGNIFDMPQYVQGKLMEYLREKMNISRI